MYKIYNISMIHYIVYIYCICVVFGFTLYAERYVVILAGGSGERLWPLSTHNTPKQLLSINGVSTLLEQTIDRINASIKKEHIWICATDELYKPIASRVHERVGRIVREPERRDTAAAILYSCFLIAQNDPDAIVLFMPSDAYIPSTYNAQLQNYIKQFYEYASLNDGIVLFGVKPNYPATGYGYIEYDTDAQYLSFHAVRHFHEKPTENIAQQYINQGNTLWNIGMFGGKVSCFIDAFLEYAPDIVASLKMHLFDGAPYASIRKVSIDYAILEKSDKVLVLPVDFIWCDVGTLGTFLSLQREHGSLANVVEIESNNNLVSAEGLVVLVGVNDLCVVRKDNVLLIVHQNATEKIRQVVNTLKNSPQNIIYI